MISFDQAVKNLLEFSTVMSPNELRDCLELPVVEHNSSVEPLSPLICERCGGTIDRESMRCLYCDTAYKSGGEFHFAYDATADTSNVLYMTFKEYESLLSSDEVLALRRYLDNDVPATMYRGKRIVIIEDKKLANIIDAYNDEIQRLRQQAINSDDVELLKEIKWKISGISDTIESFRKLYKQKQENFGL